MKKSGTWYEYNGEKLGQGRENAKKTLMQNDALFNEIEVKVKEKIYQND